jgi:hypothetical protein
MKRGQRKMEEISKKKKEKIWRIRNISKGGEKSSGAITIDVMPEGR